MKKGILFTLLALVAIVVIAGYSVRRYLQSQGGANRVATRIEAIVGGKVHVGEADVGLSSTTLRGLELAEELDGGKKGEPWLKVGSLAADLSLWDLVSGNAEPKRVTLNDVKLVLHFDANGNLTTRLPSPSGAAQSAVKEVPEVVLDGGEIVLRKEGQGDLLVTNVKARLANDAGKPVLTGTADSAELGKLLLSGSLEDALSVALVRMKTEKKVRVDQAFLSRVPLVPAMVWKEIRIDSAESTGELSARIDLKNHQFHYRIDLQPDNATLFLPAAQLPAHNASATVSIEDDRVQIRNAKAEAFGGEIRGEGDLDFHSSVYKLAFKKIEVAGLDIRDLPDSWEIPNFVRRAIANGKLYGTATVEATMTPGPLAPPQLAALHAITTSATGFAPASMIAAWPGMAVQFRTKGKGQVRDPAGKQEPVDFDWEIQPRGVPAAKAPPIRTGSLTPAKDDLHLEKLRDIIVGLALVALQQAKEQGKEPSKYLDVNLGLNNVDLGGMVKNLDLKLPVGVAGKLSFHVKASIPTDKAGDMRAYKAEGNATIKSLVIGDAHVDEINALFVYSDGVLKLQSLDGKFAQPATGIAAAGGTFKGSGTIEVVPQGELRADLLVDRIAIDQLANLGSDKIDGTFSGKLHVSAPVQKLGTLSALNADGTISSERLKLYGLSFDKVSTPITLKNGVLKLAEVHLELEGTPVGAAAELRLMDAYPFQAKLDLSKWNLASLQKLTGVDTAALPTFAGAFSTTVDVRGQLTPFQYTASGATKTQNLHIDAFTAESVQFHWETDGKRLSIKDMDAALYGGHATGAAVLPFDPKAAGDLHLSVKDVNVKKLVKDLKVPFAIEGKIGGDLKGTFPPVEKGKQRTAVVHLDIKAPKMRVQNIPAEKLTGTFAYDKGAVDYKLKGSTLGGTFDLEGQIPSDAKPAAEPKKDGAKKSRLRISGVQVSLLFRALGAAYGDSISGGLNVEVDYTHHPGNLYPEGRGVVRISDFRWKDTPLSDDLQGDIILTDQQIRLRNATAGIAEGTFAVYAAYHLKHPERSWFSIKLNRVEAAHLLGPWFGDKIEGPLDAHVRGKLGSEWYGSGDVELERGKVFGFQLSQWRIPLNWTYAPSQSRGKLEIHDSAAQLARGRAVGKVKLAWSDAIRLDGQIKLVNAELKEILSQTIGSSEWGAGQTTAQFDFGGDSVRSINDINGTLSASFRQAQALQVPVLNKVAPFVGLGQATTFQHGVLRATLAKGVFRVRQLALEGNNVQMHVDGTATLEGRLNLGIVAQTNTLGLPIVRMRFLGLRIPTTGAVPLAALQEASILLSNRVIYLQVTGTAHSPHIRVQPLQLLSQEAARYFLLRAAGVPLIPNL